MVLWCSRKKRPEDDQESSTRDAHDTTIKGSSHHEVHNVHDEVQDLKLKYTKIAKQMA